MFYHGLGVLTLPLSLVLCSRSGKTPWEKRKDPNAACSHTIKGCGCNAQIRAEMHPLYAHELGLTKLSTSLDAMPVDYPRTVKVFIAHEHTGHSPEEDSSVNLLKTDDRVRAKTIELAANKKLPLSVIFTLVHKLASELKANLPFVDPDSTNFVNC